MHSNTMGRSYLLWIVINKSNHHNFNSNQKSRNQQEFLRSDQSYSSWNDPQIIKKKEEEHINTLSSDLPQFVAQFDWTQFHRGIESSKANQSQHAAMQF